jgi:hypothetical protein
MGVVWRSATCAEADLDRVLRLYDLDKLHARAARMAQQLRIETARISSPSEAWARLLDIGGRVIRAISEDPFLPPALWGNRTGTRDLVEAYLRFEETARPQADSFVSAVIGTQEDDAETGDRSPRRHRA